MLTRKAPPDKQPWSEARSQQADCGYRASSLGKGADFDHGGCWDGLWDNEEAEASPEASPLRRAVCSALTSILWCPVYALGDGREVSLAKRSDLTVRLRLYFTAHQHR